MMYEIFSGLELNIYEFKEEKAIDINKKKGKILLLLGLSKADLTRLSTRTNTKLSGFGLEFLTYLIKWVGTINPFN